MSRRTLLTGMATLAAGIGGTRAQAFALPVYAEHRPSALPANDTRLLALQAALARADAWHDACASDVNSADATPAQKAAEASAFDAWRDTILAMAATPAESLAGVQVKVARLLDALDWGKGRADVELGESLRADLERLTGQGAA